MAKVLVADDNRQIASVLEEYLKKENHTPLIAADGEEALELFKSNKIDAVLLDVMMPKVDGFSVCHLLLREPSPCCKTQALTWVELCK